MLVTIMNKQKYFIVFVSLQLVFACIILVNEFMALSRYFPMTSSPAEHQFSWERILLFCGGAIISLLAAWFFRSKQYFMPSLLSVLVLAAFLTLSGVFTSHYLSVLGWCCESPFTFYFGFPFSFVLGIGGFDFAIQQYDKLGFLAVLSHPESVTSWKFLPYQFFLNLLFWSNIVFLFLSLTSLVVSKLPMSKVVEGQVPAESKRVF